MSDEFELDVIAEEIAFLKEQETLSASDINKLMVLVGNLTGLLRVYTDDDHTAAFINRVDNLILSGHFTIVTVFYIIPVAIEMLSKIYSLGALKRPRKRYHRRKKKVRDASESKEAIEEVKTEQNETENKVE